MSNSSSNHFTCPSGGTWYVCPNAPHFVGCCSSDPCTNVDANSTSPCPDVYYASFDPSIFNSILPNSCIDSANGHWYTCNYTDPPFLGCCSSNACTNKTGCSADDLLAAAWSSASRNQFTLFQDEGTGDNDDEGSGGGGGLSGGAIAGIVVGVVAALAIVGALVWFFMRRRNKKAAAMSGHGHTLSVVEGEHQRTYPSPAPPYHSSQFSSPASTTTGAGKDPRYMSTSSAGISLPSLSPGLPSESGRPISEFYSNSTGSEDMSQQKWAPGQSYGLGVHGAQKPEPIQELDSNVAEVHELDGLGGNRS
ncbi:hypothetical protein N7495_009614 [Penicillium taxi]|uniref:uncharacterized protein n=1 Tax=Penicillium taxi TaxID=168475 RepID=UPI002544D57D|nr:uncharacterized protein N7495_009614 [Penicillium taxi]KAJ5885104.1 hypothetical protein N7495_009614 [Penicillium taxi]